MKAFKNIFKNSKGGDIFIYVSTMILAVFGIIMIGSASIGSKKGAMTAIKAMVMQGGYVVIGAIVMRLLSKTFTVSKIKYKNCMRWYIVGIISMCLCIFWSIKGARRWIKLPGGFTLQPAEFMKIIMIVVMAYMFTKMDVLYVVKGKFRSLLAREAFYKEKFKYSVLYPLLLVALAGLVGLFLQSDLGTTFILLMICLICFLSTPRTYYAKYKKLVLLAIVIGGFLLIVVGATILKPYQLGRIYTWLNPQADYYNSGFHMVNSLIAFANGGVFGLGLGNSTQKFGYIPEAHNDFIGAIIYEELGLFGLALIIIPYCIIIFRLLKYANKVKDDTSQIILLGLSSYFFLHLLVNLGGVSGFTPMTGVPLLLLSSGGSSTLAAFVAIGIAQAIIRQYNRTKSLPPDTE